MAGIVTSIIILVAVVVGFYLGRLSQGKTPEQAIAEILPKSPQKQWASPMVISTDEVEIEAEQKRKEAQQDKERIDIKEIIKEQ